MKPPHRSALQMLRRIVNRRARRAARAALRAGRVDDIGRLVRAEWLDEDKNRCWLLSARAPT